MPKLQAVSKKGRLPGERAGVQIGSAVLVPRQSCDDLVGGRLGELLHLGVRAVLDGVRDENSTWIRTQRACLCFGGVRKNRRGDHHRWNVPAFKPGEVVHTARRARASVSEGLDHRITLGVNLAA